MVSQPEWKVLITIVFPERSDELTPPDEVISSFSSPCMCWEWLIFVNSSTASTTDSAGILSPPSAHWAPWLVSKAFHANSAPRLHFPLIKNRPSNASSARQISPVITFLRWNNTTVCRLSTSSSSHVLWAVLWTVGEKVQRCGCCCWWFAHWHTHTHAQMYITSPWWGSLCSW